MGNQYRISIINSQKTAYASHGANLGEVIKELGAMVSFPCNGNGTCGKCRIWVFGPTNEPTQSELKNLGAAELADGIRLACQVQVLGPLMVQFDSERTGEQILVEGRFQAGDTRFNSLWQRHTFSGIANLNWESIAAGLPPGTQISLELLRNLVNPGNDFSGIVIETLAEQVIEVDQELSHGPKYGVAIDVGTTTLAAYLIEVANGRIIGTAVAYNPQRSYGADLISRIAYGSTADGLAKLHQLIISAINQLLAELANRCRIETSQIVQVNMVGNTGISHLLLGINPASLGRAPFKPAISSLVRVGGAELGLKMHPRGLAYILPGIGGFIGSDITAGALVCNLSPHQNELFIDLGTNGEIILTGNGRMLACSTAAGPAFEGADISCGMLAEAGAVVDFEYQKSNPRVKTIGDIPPRGIAGTGLVRITGELLNNGIIKASGSFSEITDDPCFQKDERKYYLSRGKQPVYLDQSDIRQFQLAKGAVRAGVELLLKEAGVGATQLDRIYLAGAFGNFLRPEDAVRIGLLPEVPTERIKAVGNTAGMGCVLTVLSAAKLAEVERLAKAIEHVDLALNPEFQEIFVDAMVFPEKN